MDNIVQMQQVHGNNVVLVDFKDIGTTVPDCDALITSNPNLTLCVRVADCLPISLIDENGRAIGLIHAGWRGLTDGIIGKSIESMAKEFGIKAENLKVIIGPHICVKHYQVKNDVAVKFIGLPNSLVRVKNKVFLDLKDVATYQLVSLGVKTEKIVSDLRCTYEDSSLFSYRKNKTTERNFVYLKIPHNS